MKRLTIILLTAVFAIISGSCEREVNWPLETNNPDLIVVEGNITNENKNHEIRLSRPFTDPNGFAPAVSGADLIVSSADGVVSFYEDILRPGVYVSDQKFAGKPGRIYSLLISYQDEIISAKAGMVPGADFVFLRYIRHSNTKLFRIVWVANTYNARRAAMYEIQLDWSGVAGYEHLPKDSTTARLIYYTLPTLDVNQIFAPALETVLFPPGTIITETRYSLTDEHAGYIRALLSETAWQGGYFNSASANLPTNLSGNGIGYFGACAVTTKTEIARIISFKSETEH